MTSSPTGSPPPGEPPPGGDEDVTARDAPAIKDVIPTDAPVTDVPEVKDVFPKYAPSRPTPLGGKARAGVQLSWGVLWAMVLFIIALVLFTWRAEAYGFAYLQAEVLHSDSTATAVDTVAFRVLREHQESVRGHWLTLAQLVLLNILFPVLTALLGYIFGTQEASRNTEA